MSTAGYATTIKKGGTPVTITDEAMTNTSGWLTYQVTDAAKRILDPATTVTAKADAVALTPTTDFVVTDALFGVIDMTLAGMGGDLITDGGFEVGVGSWTSVGTNVSIATSTDQARSGTKSLKVTTTAGSPDSAGAKLAVVSSPTGGKMYRAVVRVRADATTNGLTAKAYLKEIGGAQADAENSSSAVMTSGGWLSITVVRTIVESDRTSLELRVVVETGLATNDFYYVDDTHAVKSPDAITISGKYVPTSNLAGAHAYSLTNSGDDNDATEYNTNNGYRQHLIGLLDVTLSVDRWDDLTGDLRAVLRARNSVLIEIFPGASGEMMRAWMRPLIEERSGDVSAIEAANMQFVGSDIQSPPFRFRGA